MTISILDTESVNTTGSGTTVTVTLNNVTGTDVVIVACATARTSNISFSVSSFTWDGGALTTAVNRTANLAGFPLGLSRISYLAIGNPSSLTANVVLTLSTSSAARAVTVFALQGVDQTTPLNATNNFAFTSAASSNNISVTSTNTDFVVDCLTLGANNTPSASGSQVEAGKFNISSPASAAHGTSYLLPGDASSTTMGWTWSSAPFVHVVASFTDSGFVPSGSPTITSTVSSKGTDAIIDVRDTNITINGTDLLGTVNTVVYYADTSVFATTLKVQQTINSVTSTSINWVEPSLGVLGRGMKFLFVVTNEGEIDEDISAGFAIQVEGFVTSGIPDFGRVVHVTNGSTGNQVIITGLNFTPKAAVIAAIATSNLDSIDADAPSTMCLVATNGTMGDGTTGKSAGGTVLRRKQASGTGSLIVMDASSTSATDFVTGTPVLTATGLDINFTNNTAGIRLYISIFGGDDITASVDEVQINDGSLTGLAFQPEMLIGTSVGLTQGSSGDNVFSLRTWGLANATDQCLLGFTNDETRNSTAKSGSFLGQIVGTSFTWEMQITALTSDGFTWSGSNSDSAYVLSLNLSGRNTFIGQFATTANGTDGLSESLPDFGFDPEFIVLMTVARGDELLSSAIGGRHSIGSVTAALDNRCTTTRFLPSTGGGTAEQFQSEQLILAASSTSGINTFTGKITVFGQISTIQYPIKPAVSLILHLMAIEKSSDETIATDGDSAHAAILFHGDNP